MKGKKKSVARSKKEKRQKAAVRINAKNNKKNLGES